LPEAGPAADGGAIDGPTVLTGPVSCAPGIPVPGQLYGFEDGVDGWHALHGGGTVAPSGSFATSCSASLQVTTHLDDWYGVATPAPPLPFPMTGVHKLLLDVTSTNAGTMEAIAIQFGSDDHWCQSAFTHAGPGTTTTVSVDVGALLASPAACGSPPSDPTSMRALWVFLSGGGVFYVDNVRTE